MWSVSLRADIDIVTTVVDAAHVVSGADSVTAAEVRRGEGVVAVRASPPSTPSASIEAFADGRPGVIVAGNGRVSPVDAGRRERERERERGREKVRERERERARARASE